MKFFIFTLFTVLFLGFFYASAEEENINSEFERKVSACSFKWQPDSCKRHRHCQVVNGDCKINEKVFKKMILNCQLPTPGLCKKYSHCSLHDRGCGYENNFIAQLTEEERKKVLNINL